MTEHEKPAVRKVKVGNEGDYSTIDSASAGESEDLTEAEQVVDVEVTEDEDSE